MLDAQRVQCPWCGERFETLVEDTGESSDYTEDCPVCCRPILMHLDRTGTLSVEQE